MRKNSFLFMVVILTVSIALTCCKKDKKLEIGQKHEGGIIFYLDGSGEHGMVCAESDQSTSAYWFNGTYVQTNANGSAIGTGQANTSTIVSTLGAGNYAAKICDDLVLSNYSDWFLPSFEELLLMCKNLSEVGLGSFSINNHYWSSSQIAGNGGALSLKIIDHPSSEHGYQTNYETATERVRAARTF